MAEQRVVHDPKALRAIAHPVRNRILSELDAQGSLRAADLARELGIPANQASFHLRQLAKYGLVEEDPAAARDKRDRVWRSAGTVRVDLKALEDAPGGRAASRVFRDNAAAWGQYVVAHAYADVPDDEHRSINDAAIRLTADEARALSTELIEVVERWSERTRDDRSTERAAERTTYHFLGILQPHPEPARAEDA